MDNGSKEIILLGQNVNAYNFENKRLSDLIYKLENLNGLERIKYTTSHPKDVSQDLIDAHGTAKKLMPLLHLPVQSGSTKILKKMNRKHTIEEYLITIEKLQDKNKLIKFSSDFIIAYPGEDKNDFLDTVKLMEKIKFINSFSFLYSPRPGTPSYDLKTTKIELAKERLKIFQETSDCIKKRYRQSLINQKSKVLFENKIKDAEKYFGRDEYSNSVIVNSKNNLVGKTFDVKINEFNHNTLFGSLLSVNQKDVAA